MNLLEALETIKKPLAENAPHHHVFLACGFTPLHLRTFLMAELRKALFDHHIEIETGLFGDLMGNLKKCRPNGFDALAVAMEWSDVDPRLGIRSLGGWQIKDMPDIVDTARQRTAMISQELVRIAQSTVTVCTLPTLPLPAMFSTRTHESSMWELELRQIITNFAVSISREQKIRVLSSQSIDEISPLGSRFDAKSEIMAGFPYKLQHAAVLGKLIASLINNPAPKKGLITDLDDTLWSGILGEVGCGNVCWHLESKAQEHGIYQQFLSSLASAGVLIAVASKNDAALVQKAFARKDLILSKDDVFPFEVHWSLKSTSVERILKIWNISSDSVVFIDDSPMETAEVKAAFPEIECFTFPKGDYQGTWDLIKRLRDLFGKSIVSEDDALRLQSIRGATIFRDSVQSDSGNSDDFLAKANAVVSLYCGKGDDQRSLELLNKTNQFNLNGRRLTEGEWSSYLRQPDTFLLTVNYEDKYGPLGKISVLLGKYNGRGILVDLWVMSCRAFSRRIEHQCLKFLFDKFGVDELEMDYQPTDRNGPLREFVTQLTDIGSSPPLKITKARFLEQIPHLCHRVEVIANG